MKVERKGDERRLYQGDVIILNIYTRKDIIRPEG